MQSYYTYGRAEDVHTVEINLSENEQPIFVGSPFYGFPATDVEVAPVVAVTEQNRTHAVPMSVFGQYVNVLREDFAYDHIPRWFSAN